MCKAGWLTIAEKPGLATGLSSRRRRENPPRSGAVAPCDTSRKVDSAHQAPAGQDFRGCYDAIEVASSVSCYGDRGLPARLTGMRGVHVELVGVERKIQELRGNIDNEINALRIHVENSAPF